MGDGFGIGLGMAAIALFASMWGMFDRWMQHREKRFENANLGDQNSVLRNDVKLLSHENEELTGKIYRLEERLSVLEKIATDPARRTAEEIEQLR